MQSYLRDKFASTIVHAAMLRWKLKIKLATSPKHSTQTPREPVLALTLHHQTTSWVATWVPVWKSLLWLNKGKQGSFPNVFWSPGGRSNTLIIIIIIIAFKGGIRDFLQSPHSAANCLQHVRSSGPGAIMCKSCATHRALITFKCHVTCHVVRRDSSAIKFDRVEIAFVWALFYLLNH